MGVIAGVLTGALAGILHSMERTADLQEKVRRITQDVEKMSSALRSDHVQTDNARSEVNGLSRDLDEIHEEIRRMYKKGKS